MEEINRALRSPLKHWPAPAPVAVARAGAGRGRRASRPRSANEARHYLPSGDAVHDQLALLAAHQDLVLDFALARAQVAALDGEQSAALEGARSWVDLRAGVCVGEWQFG